MTDLESSGTKLRCVAEGFHFPTSLCFDGDGGMYVAESGLPFGGAPAGGRVWRMDVGGGSRTLLADGLRQPVNGLAFHDGALWVSEGGNPGRITRLALDGTMSTVLDGLPGHGNYHTNMVVFGPDGMLYFSQGAMTNSGIVGLDAFELAWLRRLPQGHDIPGLDVVLRGVDVETPNPLGADGETVRTAAFAPFGTPGVAGRRIAGRVPCTAAVMRCRPDGSDLELVAWGLRNAFGLGFLPDGTLLAVDQGADDRGSRPVGNAPDLLVRVEAGAWYGWPDFIDGVAVSDDRYLPERGPRPEPLVDDLGSLPRPERALMAFPAHTAAVKFDVAPPSHGEHPGHLFVALFGDERPMTAPPGPRVGRSVARVDPRDWSLHPVHTGPLLRPIDVRFAPGDGALHVLDFGFFEMHPGREFRADAGTGRVWRAC